MNTDLDKLRVLLPHWLEHNAEHASEFWAWAARARMAGDEHLAEHIEAAAQQMEAAMDGLKGAIEHLGGELDHAHLHHHHNHIH